MIRLQDVAMALAGVGASWALPDPFIWSASGSVLGAAMAGLVMDGSFWQRCIRSFCALAAGLAFGEALALHMGYETRAPITACSAAVAFLSWTILRPLDQRGISLVKDLLPMAGQKLARMFGGNGPNPPPPGVQP